MAVVGTADRSENFEQLMSVARTHKIVLYPNVLNATKEVFSSKI